MPRLIAAIVALTLAPLAAGQTQPAGGSAFDQGDVDVDLSEAERGEFPSSLAWRVPLAREDAVRLRMMYRQVERAVAQREATIREEFEPRLGAAKRRIEGAVAALREAKRKVRAELAEEDDAYRAAGEAALAIDRRLGQMRDAGRFDREIASRMAAEALHYDSLQAKAEREADEGSEAVQAAKAELEAARQALADAEAELAQRLDRDGELAILKERLEEVRVAAAAASAREASSERVAELALEFARRRAFGNGHHGGYGHDGRGYYNRAAFGVYPGAYTYGYGLRYGVPFGFGFPVLTPVARNGDYATGGVINRSGSTLNRPTPVISNVATNP